MTKSRQILIIGSSIAGISAAESARAQDPDAEITVVSQDEFAPYYRLRLCEVLDDPEIVPALALHPPAWYEERHINLRLGRKAIELDPEAHTVGLDNNEVLKYDSLVLTTGSHSFVPDIPGKNRPGVYTLWSMADALRLEQALRPVKKAVVIGGGLLGLEAAYHVSRQNIATTIIERLPHLLANQLDDGGSTILEHRISNLGIDFITSADVVALDGISDEAGSPVRQVRLADGKTIEADIVIISIGVRANVELAQKAGLKVNRRITTDKAMRTSHPDIYAAGDAAEPLDYWFGLWSVSRGQGRTAGTNAAGGTAEFDLRIPPYIVNTMETKVIVEGDKGIADLPRYELDVLMDEDSGNYRKLVYREGIFSGFMLIGDTHDFLRLQKELEMES
ncbi:MAG: NAD(P)/FAD-dependent oxidoreductase [Ruminococcaceae bacterium]|nr:NAD(P)/FAD-dependent oxidoreductase [Oscillospiraceae bacterium]